MKKDKIKNSVQRIKPIILDTDNIKDIKKFKKEWDKHNKYLKKTFMKAMFTKWERIKLFFMGVKI